MKPAPLFHPAVASWFATRFAAPTPAQAQAWPAVQAGHHTLIAAPTGSGKTLAAFLAAIDGLVRQGLDGCLDDATQVVYVSPLKALSNDIQRNLEEPLAGIRAALREQRLPDVEIRTWVRTGDTPQSACAACRARMRCTDPQAYSHCSDAANRAASADPCQLRAPLRSRCGLPSPRQARASGVPLPHPCSEKLPHEDRRIQLRPRDRHRHPRLLTMRAGESDLVEPVQLTFESTQ